MTGSTIVIAATISDIESVDVTAIVGTANPNQGSTSGSNGAASFVMRGSAFPNAKLTLLKDGAVYTTLVANSDGQFNLTVNGLNFGNYQFSLYAQDRNGLDSSSYTVNVPISEIKSYVFNDILVPPTIKSDNLVIALGQSFNVTGYAAANSKILVEVPGVKTLATGMTDSSGYYSIPVLADMSAGLYQIRTRVELNGVQSLYSKPVQVLYYKGVPGEPLPPPPSQLASCADYNKDYRINLIDFSILLFWFGKDNPPKDIDCNGDHTINIKDFSILMYFWTS
jgi:hypothetical protein